MSAYEKDRVIRDKLGAFGVSVADCRALRRIEMTLHRWGELECGDANACIERDENTGKAYMRNSLSGNRYPVADRERGALRRLGGILARYPSLRFYHQTDPRGCALYLLRPGDVPDGADVSGCYERGIAVCA